jgi:hypothetical protein
MDEDEKRLDKAFPSLCLHYLGCDESEGTHSDGKGDHGIDFWMLDEIQGQVFQFKSAELPTSASPFPTFGPEYLTDIPRVQALLSDLDNIPADANDQVATFLRRLRSEISRRLLTQDTAEHSYSISLYLCCLASGLTPRLVRNSRASASMALFPMEDAAFCWICSCGSSLIF